MIVLRFQCVTHIMSHQLTRPDDREVTQGHSGHTDARKPHHHRRFPKRSDVLPAAWRWSGVPRMCPRLRHVPRLSAEIQSHLSRRLVPDPSLPLCPCPAGWSHHLAHPMYEVQSGVHRATALRLELSSDATGGGSRCPDGYTRWAQLRVVCGHLPYLPHGSLSLGLRVWPPKSAHGAYPVWAAPAHLCFGR